MSQSAPVYKGRLMRKQAAAAAAPDADAPEAPRLSEAEQMLADARAEARAILERAQEEAREEAAEILRLAREDAEAETRAILEDAETRVARRVLELTEEARKDLDVTQPIIAELVFTSINRILEDFDDAELIRRIVARGISELRENRRIIVRVHADDYSQVRYALWKSDLGFSGVIDSVEIDSKLAPGQLILDTGRAQVDVGLESQLKLLREHLLPEYGGEEKSAPLQEAIAALDSISGELEEEVA